MAKICGIDYSMTSPAMCIHHGDVWSHKNCTFLYLAKTEKACVTEGQFAGTVYPKYSCDTERYHNLSQWAFNTFAEYGVDKCYIEGYAFNAVGRVFQIAENTGLLKYSMWKSDIDFDVFTPSMIKKFATGKGNSNKEAMYESFLEETNIDIREALKITSEKQWNPLSDIVDAYYIAKLGFEKGKENVD
jgi:Holliday junction resolvasome RuvABC endonuclease subunit